MIRRRPGVWRSHAFLIYGRRNSDCDQNVHRVCITQTITMLSLSKRLQYVLRKLQPRIGNIILLNKVPRRFDSCDIYRGDEDNLIFFF